MTDEKMKKKERDPRSHVHNFLVHFSGYLFFFVGSSSQFNYTERELFLWMRLMYSQRKCKKKKKRDEFQEEIRKWSEDQLYKNIFFKHEIILALVV